MSANERFLTQRQRYQPVTLPQDFSDEEMARDWTLTTSDQQEIGRYRARSRLFIAIQICAVRLYGRFIQDIGNVSPRIVSYLNNQLALPPSLSVVSPEREATLAEQRKNILTYLGFIRYDENIQSDLKIWLVKQAEKGFLPDELFLRAGQYLLSAGIKLAIDDLLVTLPGDQRSLFYLLKESPPSATVTSIKRYMKRYYVLDNCELDTISFVVVDPAFMSYLYKLACRYSARDIKRFKAPKRYSLMLCFLLETRKVLLDNLVKMHDQFIMDLLRHGKCLHEQKHRELRKRQKKAIDTILEVTNWLPGGQDDRPLFKKELWQSVNEKRLLGSVDDLHAFKRLEERGFGDILVARYPGLCKYFSEFLRLPFRAKAGTESLLDAIMLLRQLDNGEIKRLPGNVPTHFVPYELQRILKGKDGKVQRNAWELGVAIAMKDALRSGDLFVPQSKQHVSFWDLMLDQHHWQATREAAYTELQQPTQENVKTALILEFHQIVGEAEKRFELDSFAEIKGGNLRLQRDDKAEIPESVTTAKGHRCQHALYSHRAITHGS